MIGRAVRAALALAAVGLLSLAATAGAQDGYTGAWTDPNPSGERDGKPLAYLDRSQPLTGQVSHPNGIARVSAVLVPSDDAPARGCEATLDPNPTAEPNGTTTVFHLTGTFPCNLVYELRATAHANQGTGIASSPPAPYAMPLFLAVAIPPEPVAYLDATLTVDGDDREVLLEWPGGSEPDLLGYVVTRDGESLGQVDADDPTMFTDDDAPAGATATYAVTVVRTGPDGDVEQVASVPTTVDVEVPAPAEREQAEGEGGSGTTGSGGATGDPENPQLAGEATQAEVRGRPDPGSLASVRARGGSGRPSLGPPTTLDTGFAETLPFDPANPQAAAPSLPAGDSAVVAVFEERDQLDDKQRLAFIAGGLAVLVAAAAIMHVTRRAAREAY